MNIDDLREEILIEDYIGERIELEKAGVNYRACCPFHSEKTPSFVVSPVKQIFKCFGCGIGGNIFRFIQEYEGVSFRESVAVASKFAGVPVSKLGYSSKKQHIYDALSGTAEFFISCRDEKAFQDFVEERNLSDDIIDEYMIGYAPDSYVFEIPETSSGPAGLLAAPGKPKFRGRVMFPFTDPTGNVIGFTGRDAWNSDKRPKYLNSSSTPLFKKGEVLFGFYQAKPYIRESSQVILVEGQMDVIATAQAGMRNVLASSGTAFTKRQALLLSKHCKSVIIMFDGDKAGKEATVKTIPLLLEQGLFVEVVSLDEGCDPGDYDPEDLVELTKEACDWIEFLWKDVTNSQEKIKATRQIVDILKDVHNFERDVYLYRVEEVTGVSFGNLKKSLNTKRSKIITEHRTTDLLEAEEHLLQLAVRYPSETIPVMRELFNVRDFSIPRRGAVKILYSLPDKPETSDIYSLFDTEDQDKALSYISGLLIDPDAPSERWSDPSNIRDEINNVVRRLKVDQLDGMIMDGVKDLPPDEIQALLEERKTWLSM